jgi:hypothetical protein
VSLLLTKSFCQKIRIKRELVIEVEGQDRDTNLEIEKVARAIELRSDAGPINVKIISSLTPSVLQLVKLLLQKQITV